VADIETTGSHRNQANHHSAGQSVCEGEGMEYFAEECL